MGRHAVQAVATASGSALPMVFDLLILLRRCSPDVVGGCLAGCWESAQLGKHSTRASLSLLKNELKAKKEREDAHAA
jgi:hypothetical protein